jgi:diguanylate cyclase (GGDEF)-like protein
VYDIVGHALTDAVPDLDVELLIADSSRAHFSRVLATHDDPEHAAGCGVVSPRDCPAAIRAHTLIFPSSDAINACPHLKDRPSGSCSAACIPVSIAGRGVGVVHATGANRIEPTPGDVDKMEFSTRRAAERLALIRTFETSETQARTDPLTGLLNRRSLENSVRELQSDGIPYALAYGDLDFFKALNDTHGHEAGDQALRLFSRLMRDSVRPADLVSRYGGEEFVIVLPDCTTETATAVLERLREGLALSLTGGRVPAFTVSFGLASSADADTFEEIVAVADHALLAAKAAGRNRVIVADYTKRLLPAAIDGSLGSELELLDDGP